MPRKRQRSNRPIERETINTIRTFFDKHNIPIMEVPFDVDYGKDIYVELADREGVTGRVIALQAKGGDQTRRTRSTGEIRGVPFTASDSTVFRESNIPVLGMLYERERNELLWVDLTGHCSASYELRGQDEGGFAETTGRLNDYRLPAFINEMLLLTKSSRHEIGLDLASDNLHRQRSAIMDCFGLGLKDARPLLLVRRMLIWFNDPIAAKLAVQALAHFTPHPDIFFHPGNTPKPAVEERVRGEMLWSPRELGFLLRIVEDDEEMWGRGVFGQHIVSLILSDKYNADNLLLIVGDRGIAVDVRRRAFVIALYMASYVKNRDLADRVIVQSGDLHSDEWVSDIIASYNQFGYIDIY